MIAGMESREKQALSLALSVRDFVLRVERYRADIARHHDVGSTEIVALGHLFVQGPLTVGELARELDITSASATEVVDRLENAGFAERQPHPTDRRKRFVGLTPLGIQVTRAFYSDFGCQLHAIYEQLSPSQQDGIEKFLGQVAADLARPYLPAADIGP